VISSVHDAATLRFDIVDVMSQPNASDCGVFVLANATEFAYLPMEMILHCVAGMART